MAEEMHGYIQFRVLESWLPWGDPDIEAACLPYVSTQGVSGTTGMAAQQLVTAIFQAARSRDAGEVARLLDAEPHLLEATASWEYRTLLYEAVESGHTDMVRVLLKRGADVNASTNYGWTPLHKAAMGGHEEVVSALLSSGADTSRQTSGGNTALYLASIYGHLGVVRQLLQHNPACGPDERNNHGLTALWGACCCGYVEVARALLLAGADHTIASNDGQTPRQIAEQEGHTACVALLEWWEGELERAYALHRSRRVHEDSSSRQQAPEGPVPPYLRARVERSKPLPRVHAEGSQGGRTTRASAKRNMARRGGEPSEEEKGAMLKYVIQDLAPELYIELVGGFHH